MFLRILFIPVQNAHDKWKHKQQNKGVGGGGLGLGLGFYLHIVKLSVYFEKTV